MKRVCVFCGSRAGNDPAYQAAAVALGELLAVRGIELVYGGGSVGLMGVVADSVLERGGHVIGVLPEALATKELLHGGVPDMRVVPNMHARKALMAELSDGFIALPGGLGTLEELFEIVTWAQLGLHRKNIGLLDVAGYFTPLMAFIDHSIAAGFIAAPHRELIVMRRQPEELLNVLQTHKLPNVRRWFERGET